MRVQKVDASQGVFALGTSRKVADDVRVLLLARAMNMGIVYKHKGKTFFSNTSQSQITPSNDPCR